MHSSLKDFLTGLILLIVGGGALAMALGYRMGTVTQMGPGYFPALVAGLLALVGLVLAGRAVFIGGLSPAGLSFGLAHLWQLAIIIGAIVAFALLLKPLGLVPSVILLVLVSAAASGEFRPVGHTLLALGLALTCYLLFMKFLQLPLSAFGTALAG